MSNWLDRMSVSFGRFLDGIVPESRAAPTGSQLYTPSYQLDKPRWLDSNIGSYRSAFASQTAVYSCILARSRGVASATLRVYQESQGDRDELSDHPLRVLMQRPNPMLSEAEFLVMTQTMMDATGFCAIEKERAAAGNVIGLWHLRSDWLKEIRRRNRASDWEYRVPGNEPVTIKAEDVIIVAGGPSTDLGTIGMSPIAVALREIGIDSSLTDFLKLFVDKGGVPPYALVTPNNVKDQAEADLLRGLFAQTYGGFSQWLKPALLAGGLDVKKIGSNIDEFAYPELRNLTEAHICMVFGVPPIIAGVQAGLDASTYSNYEQARRAFFEDTIAALWARLDGALTRGLLSEFTDDSSISIEFDTSAVPALQQDQGQLWERTRAMLSAGGMTLNQAQMAVGLPGIGKAGDVLYLPLGVQPVLPDDLLTLAGFTAEPPQPVPAALTGGDEGDGETENDQGAVSADDGEEEDRAIGYGDSAGSRPILGDGPEHVRIITLPLETRARIATTNRRNTNRIASKFAPRIARLFREQGKRVAGAYAEKGQTEIPEVRALDALDWDELEREMEKELRQLYESAGRLAFVSAGNQLDQEIDWSLSNPKIRQTINLLARRVVGINETTRVDVGRIVTDGMEEGLTAPQIAETLKELFAETYRNRSMAIARTESQVSYNMATADAYRESGVVQAMQCHDNTAHIEDYGAEDGRSCAQRDGVITDVDSVSLHVFSEHPNGTLAVSPLLVRPLGVA